MPGPVLSGASGGPLIVIRDKQPQIIGAASTANMVFASGGYPLFATGSIHAAGVGELPKYLQEAEKIQEEAKKQAEVAQNESESWVDYFKRSLWGK